MTIGTKAPDLLGFNEKGEEIRLSHYAGKKLVEAMGVWGEKSMYGRKYMGTFRTTFIINEEGIVERIFLPKEIKVKEHAEQILKDGFSPAPAL